jgi:hypothetical protein
MVIANKRLLQLIRRAAIRDELLAMRLRARLVVPPMAPPSDKPGGRPPR